MTTTIASPSPQALIGLEAHRLLVVPPHDPDRAKRIRGWIMGTTAICSGVVKPIIAKPPEARSTTVFTS